MGKSKPRTRVKVRANPIAKPPADPALAAFREERVLPLLRDLQSAELKTRSAAVLTIRTLLEDQKARKQLLRDQIVQILLEHTITDLSLETRKDGWGILQMLANEEEADFSIHLYRRDILTAIEGAIQTVVATLESVEPKFRKLPKPQQEIVWSLTTSISELLSSLAEAQEEILQAINKSQVIPDFLCGLLSFKNIPEEALNEVLSCITVLTEDNKTFSDRVMSQKWEELNTLSNAHTLIAVLACGVLHNCFISLQWFDHNTPKVGASDAMLIPKLVKFTESQSNGTTAQDENSSSDESLQLALQIIASIATSLEEALEHASRNEKPFEGFAEIEPVEDEHGDDEEMGDGDELAENGEAEEDEEMNDDEIDADMAMVTGGSPEPDGDDDGPIEEATLESLIRIAAPKVLTLAHKTISDEGEVLQNPALATLSNIAWTISNIDLDATHLVSLRRYWFELAQKIWNTIVWNVLDSSTANIEFADSITSLAWGLLRSVKGVMEIHPGDHRKLMSLYNASDPVPGSTEEFQGLGVKCIGALGALALNPAPVELNREIGVFLIRNLAALPDKPPQSKDDKRQLIARSADAVEALNRIFEIYDDKSHSFDEPVFWGDNFYTHLEEILPRAKVMQKNIDKREFGELRERADDAVEDLRRFLVYKRKERKSRD